MFVNATLTKPIRRQKVNEQFNVYSMQLGFYITPHVLRHTFAAHLAQRGMPLCAIKKLLGHDRMDTTQIYARLYGEAQKEMYDEWM
ncbi:tyrosine-type recombinase/integrase (plasmid) [Alkalihalophilus pseudofirmus]|uniref:tyrosine-type recombinase/integrase n=1 Tax=Alkalihalophilus pseudofirmus TaxID=79885 RepID=UPI00259B8667|nr:tyrosine-type recombinase/integrase [Alkalihalophilus pseudofirmus]WEG19272.1 tyrosine-type recombinase/integrase [Alkalihalophilus pseudofirmus]